MNRSGIGSKRRRRNGGASSSKRYKSAPRRRRLNLRTAGFLGIEKKFYDTSLANATLVGNGTATAGEHNPSATICLNSVVEGSGEQNRDGRKMVMKYVSISGVIIQAIIQNQTSPGPSGYAQISLVLDKQCNGALLDSESVFTNPSGDTNLSGSLFRNLQYIQRFQVLKTVLVKMPAGEVSYDGTNLEVGAKVTPFKMNVKLNDIPVNFTGTTETIANIVDNSLNLIAFPIDIGTSVYSLYYNSRLRFVG